MFDKFSERHIGVSNEKELKAMLETIGVKSVDELISQVIPHSIRLKKPLALPAEGMSEYEFAGHIRAIGRAQPAACGRSSAWATTPARFPAAVTAQRLRESRVVHLLYALSGRDFAGPSRSAAELPDRRDLAHGHGDRQLLAAGRGDRRRRGDADDVRPALARSRQGGPQPALRRPRTSSRRRSTCCSPAANPSASN